MGNLKVNCLACLILAVRRGGGGVITLTSGNDRIPQTSLDNPRNTLNINAKLLYRIIH